MVIAAQQGWKPLSSFAKAELDRMGSLEFHYHELLSHDAVSAALEVADQKHEAQDEPIKMVETDLTYDKIQKMSASEARAAQLRDPKGWRLAFAREERTEDRTGDRQQVADEFAKRAPAFARTEAKAVKIANWMAANDLDGTKISSYLIAF